MATVQTTNTVTCNTVEEYNALLAYLDETTDKINSQTNNEAELSVTLTSTMLSYEIPTN